jgi:biopolymer transport protein ExbB
MNEMNAKTSISAATAVVLVTGLSSSAWAQTTVENPYGLDALWAEGDVVSKTTLIILVIMSLGTWYIGILKFLEQAKLFKQSKEVRDKVWRSETIVSGISDLKEESAFRFIAQSANDAAKNHETEKLQKIDFGHWVDMALQRAVNLINGRLQGGLPFLATVGSTAPFVGLFGTVWGIYHALTAIGMSGQASIDKVAGPVGEALIMTAIGLAVAVPAVLGYNWLIRRNKVVMEQVKHFSAELQMVLLSGK